MCTEAKSAAAGFQNLLVVAVLMVRSQVERAALTTSSCIAFFLYQFLIIPANFEIPVSTREGMEDFKKKKKKEKWKKRGNFFLFCAPLPIAIEVKIGGGGAAKLTR